MNIMKFTKNEILEEMCKTFPTLPWDVSSLLSICREQYKIRPIMFKDIDSVTGRIAEAWLNDSLKTIALKNREIEPDIFPYDVHTDEFGSTPWPLRHIRYAFGMGTKHAEYDGVMSCGDLPVILEIKTGQRKNYTSLRKVGLRTNHVYEKAEVLKNYFGSVEVGYVLILPDDWKRKEYGTLTELGVQKVILEKTSLELRTVCHQAIAELEKEISLRNLSCNL